MSDGIHNAADLFQKIGKNELKRKDLIKLAHQEASQESSEHLFRNLYSALESIDKDKNGIFTKKEANVLFADGKSLEENFEDLKKARADNYNSRSPQEKLNIAVNDARQFLKDTDSKKLTRIINLDLTVRIFART
ncbi:MAG: hypothetical protein MZU97_02045 [Bacillus subtilis]|nr:hypothetical protein [Bacillus subtilis]